MQQPSTSRLQSLTFLEKTRRHSLELCAQLEGDLKQLELSTYSVVSIFAVGSLGRLEVGPSSDLDGVVVVDSILGQQKMQQIMGRIENCYRKLNFRIAKASGIYRLPVEISQLVDLNQRGRLDENPEIYGKRIQIMLDARPIFDPAKFAILQGQVLEWFLPKVNGQVSYSFLTNELQRYFHSYASWQLFKFEKSEDDGWYLRQAKLRVTRVVTVGAMMLLIGLAMQTEDDPMLRKQLAATPIERLAFVFDFYNEGEFLQQFLSLYERALTLLLDERVRDELVTQSPQNMDETAQPFPASFRQLYDISDELMSMLTAFTLRRQTEWPISFYRNWLF